MGAKGVGFRGTEKEGSKKSERKRLPGWAFALGFDLVRDREKKEEGRRWVWAYELTWACFFLFLFLVFFNLI